VELDLREGDMRELTIDEPARSTTAPPARCGGQPRTNGSGFSMSPASRWRRSTAASPASRSSSTAGSMCSSLAASSRLIRRSARAADPSGRGRCRGRTRRRLRRPRAPRTLPGTRKTCWPLLRGNEQEPIERAELAPVVSAHEGTERRAQGDDVASDSARRPEGVVHEREERVACPAAACVTARSAQADTDTADPTRGYSQHRLEAPSSVREADRRRRRGLAEKPHELPPAPNGRRPPCPSGTSTAQRTWIAEPGFATRGRAVCSSARAPSLLVPPGASTSAASKTAVTNAAIRTLGLHRARCVGSNTA
jgi:hypothetical protein